MAEFLALGYRSFKLKIEPGHDLAVVATARAETGDGVVIQVDANGSYTSGDAEHLAELDALGVACLEQPLAPDALLDHARLAAGSGRRSGSTRRSRARASRGTCASWACARS